MEFLFRREKRKRFFWFIPYVSKEVSLPAPHLVNLLNYITELEATAKEKIVPSAFHFHSLRTLSVTKMMTFINSVYSIFWSINR